MILLFKFLNQFNLELQFVMGLYFHIQNQLMNPTDWNYFSTFSSSDNNSFNCYSRFYLFDWRSFISFSISISFSCAYSTSIFNFSNYSIISFFSSFIYLFFIKFFNLCYVYSRSHYHIPLNLGSYYLIWVFRYFQKKHPTPIEDANNQLLSDLRILLWSYILPLAR